MLFSIFATLSKWSINPRKWLTCYWQSCAENGGQVPSNPAAFLPWNLAADQCRALGEAPPSDEAPDSS